MRERVRVLGGGIAGLTAALELTATPELRERYEVTLHQLGWRCGGKCATGRSAARGNRVEEHGLHLWFGGYDNAFRLLGDCYDELDRPADHPMATMDDAWSPLSSVVLWDLHDGRWSACERDFDIEPGRPWDDVEVPRFWDLLVNVLHAVEGHAAVVRSASRGVDHDRVGFVGRVLRSIGDRFERMLVRSAGGILDRHHAAGTHHRSRVHPVAAVLERVRERIWERHVRDHLDIDEVRHGWSQTDLMLTSMIGMIRDELLWEGFGSINHLDFSDWLVGHGLQPATLQGPDLRVVYDQCFSGNTGPAVLDPGPQGTAEQRRGMAAGAALYSLVRTKLPYRGSVMWQANAGMGDTAIAPMYETLVQRGVRVELFQAVEHLGVDGDRVTSIDVVEQATPIDGYDPLVDVETPRGTIRCWPAEPRWDQLVDGEALSRSGIDFEAGEAQPDAPRRRLAVGEDFDTVVLAISAAALPAICDEVIAASEPFARMLRNTTTMATQAFQVWLDETPEELGFPQGHTATSTFIEPLDTGADNSQVLWSEAWGGRSVWYFCGDLPDGPETVDPTAANAKVRADAEAYLRRLPIQWPGFADGDDVRWGALHADGEAAGTARLDQQFWKANTAPTERYVQTMPGTVEHRLAADESGLANLVLAGDWIRNGFDIGAVEATVMSGMQAARAVSGSPEHIAWDDHRWLVDG